MSKKMYSRLKEYSRDYKPKHSISKIISVIIGVALFITFLVTVDYEKTFEEIHAIKTKPKTPDIVWYTPIGLHGGVFYRYEENKTISCPNNNKTVTCNVFSKDKYEGQADAYIFYGTYFKVYPKRDKKMLWGLVHEESPKNAPELMHEETLNLFNFSATFSRFSDVPMPLQSLGSVPNIVSTQFYVKTAMKNSICSTYLAENSSAIAPVLYMHSNCDPFTERDEFVEKLMKLIPVDSYGDCLNNKKFPNTEYFKHLANRGYVVHMDDDEILHFIAKYKFVVAIENAVCDDYVTEKFWRAIHVGIVPIYYGSPLIKDWLPNPKSAILLENFPTPELLSEHLYDLLQNDTRYEEYLEHKTKGIISNFRIFEELESRPYQTSLSLSIDKLYCVMCERLHETSDRVNIVSKKHHNCYMPTPAFNISDYPSKVWSTVIELAKVIIDEIYYSNNTK